MSIKSSSSSTSAEGHYPSAAQQIANLEAERETLIAALRVARKAVYAMAEGSHLLDGFGPRKRTPLDDDLDQVEAALASVGKGVNG